MRIGKRRDSKKRKKPSLKGAERGEMGQTGHHAPGSQSSPVPQAHKLAQLTASGFSGAGAARRRKGFPVHPCTPSTGTGLCAQARAGL